MLNLTHQEIADELGTNRVTVSRLLKSRKWTKATALPQPDQITSRYVAFVTRCSMCYRKPARPHDIFVKYKLYNKLNQQIMSLRLNDIAPDFTQQLPRAQFNSTNGWGMDGPYCFHIRKTLRLCTTELGYMVKTHPILPS